MYVSDHHNLKAIAASVSPYRTALVEQENRMYRKCMIAAYVALALLFAFFVLRQG